MGNQIILAADIGATKTNLGLYKLEGGLRSPMKEATYASPQFKNFDLILEDFLARDNNLEIDMACFGVPGPVEGNQASTTNLPWLIEADKIENRFNIRKVLLVNDLAATAISIPHLNSEELFCIQKGICQEKGNIAVIAPGTGLGEAFLVTAPNGDRIAQGSEGGHADFAPMDQIQQDLLTHLRERIGHVSYENVCSGRGLPNIYDFLLENDLAKEPDWLKERLDGCGDPVPEIVRAAIKHGDECEICDRCIRLFVAILGAEAGNLAIRTMATGGIYIGGGIVPRIINILDSHHFLKFFLNKGRVAGLLARIPVHVIMNPKAALMGAAAHAITSLTQAERVII